MNNIAKKIDAVIFDLDGTITKPILDFDEIRKEIGISSGPVWETIVSMHPESRKRAEEILLGYELRAAKDAELNDGAKEIFAILKERDIECAILTRNCRKAWEIVRDKFGLVVEYVFTREDGPLKPDPLAVMQIIEAMGVKAERTLVVGDYLFDIEAGRRAGTQTALFVNGRNVPEYAENADYVIDDLLAIADIVDGRKARWSVRI